MAGWHASMGHTPGIHYRSFTTMQQTVPQFVVLAPEVLLNFRTRLIDRVFTPVHFHYHCTSAHMLLLWSVAHVCCRWWFVSRSLSYVMCMGCFSFLLLAGIYFVSDMKGWWAGRPFVYPGTLYSQNKGFSVVLRHIFETIHQLFPDVVFHVSWMSVSYCCILFVFVVLCISVKHFTVFQFIVLVFNHITSNTLVTSQKKTHTSISSMNKHHHHY